MSGYSAVKTLGKKRIHSRSRRQLWLGHPGRRSYAAAKEYGAEIVGYDEVSLATTDFITTWGEGSGGKAGCFYFTIRCRCRGAPAEVHQMGLGKETTFSMPLSRMWSPKACRRKRSAGRLRDA